MRPKVIFAIVLCGLLALAGLLVLRSHSRSDAGTEGARNTSDDATAGSSYDASLGGVISGAGSSKKPAAPPRLPAPAARRLYANRTESASAMDGLTAEQQEDAVNQRIIELSELATRDDSASLGVLLSELTNDNADIRRAALDGVMQSGNLEAIPALQQLAERSVDPQQKREIAEAIEFLTLPSISDLAARGAVARPSVQVPRSAPFGRR